VTGNDPYGTGTAFDAIGDIKQLQHETRRKAQAIDKMVDPPMRADVQLKNNPAALIPGGVTYVSGLGTGRVGIEPDLHCDAADRRDEARHSGDPAACQDHFPQ
jgi:hypothetical protein